MNLVQLTDTQLFAILNCDALEELEIHFEPGMFRQLIAHKRTLFNIKNPHKLMPSLFSKLDDSSTPIYIVWGAAGFITGALATTILSIASLGLVPIVGGVYCYHTHRQSQKKIAEWDGYFQLACLKFQAANELIYRYRNEVNCLPIKNAATKNFEENFNHRFTFFKNTHHTPKSQSAGMAITSGFTIFGCFYLGITSIIQTLGFVMVAGALSGPIGLGIAVAISVLAGLYIGYQHYQAKKNSLAIKSCKKEMNKEINDIRDQCYQLKK